MFSGISKKFRRPSSSFAILNSFWFFYVTVLLFFYECNLRAFLVTVNTEPPIDNDQDVVEQGKKLFLPKGQTSFISLYRNTKNPYQKQLFDVSRQIRRDMN